MRRPPEINGEYQPSQPEQFGKKVRQHAREFGLDPASSVHRAILKMRIVEVYYGSGPVRQGSWRGGAVDNLFYSSGSDVVVTTADGVYVTVLRGGVSNGWFQSARLLP